MARHENAISTLQARTILSGIRSSSVILSTRDVIEKTAVSVVESLEKLFPVQFPSDTENHCLFMAFALSACGKEAVKRGELSVLDYIAMLASEKEENEKAETSYNGKADFGAFGDLYEVLIRCALVRKYSLVRWSMLSVKDIKHSDIVSKNFGIIEAGHNGKTLSFGTLFDFMEGEYTSVIYGVFSEEDKKAVYALCKNKDYDKAVEYVCEYSAYWSDKYAFQHDMDNLTRGKGIAVKGCNIQVVYNSGKYDAFLSALESGTIKSLAETLSE